jgi:hypothetical protein
MVDFQKSREDKKLDSLGFELKAKSEKVVEEKAILKMIVLKCSIPNHNHPRITSCNTAKDFTSASVSTCKR